MAIRYAGEPLLMEDPSGRLAAWVEHYLCLEGTRLWGDEPQAVRENRGQSRSGHALRVGLSAPNWPQPPQLRLNTLWWPTGASRWARGLFLADTERLGRIVELVRGNQYGYASLELTDVRPGATEADWADEALPVRRVKVPMYMLPPRPISTSATSSNLWLLPLVDQRYFWQWRDAPSLEILADPATSWAGMYAMLAQALEINLAHDPVAYDAGGYATHPDRLEFTRAVENAAVLLDAVAWSVGQRIVVRLDGRVEALNAATSLERRTDNFLAALAAGHPTLAGGTARSRTPIYPEKIKLVFPRSRGQYLRPDGATWEITRNASAYFTLDSDGQPLQAAIPGTTKTFFATAYADTDFSTTAAPRNLGQLESLAGQIARDFVEYLSLGDDTQFLGWAFGWTPTGFEDGMLFELGSQFEQPALATKTDRPQDASQYRYSTRIRSLPPDVGTSHLLHQWIPYAETLGLTVWPFELLEELPQGVCRQPVRAVRRHWNSGLCDGKGGLEVRLDPYTGEPYDEDIFYVGDYNLEDQYYGEKGTLGAAELMDPDYPLPDYQGKKRGRIADLQCPEELVGPAEYGA
ncbi:MAG: hypothetical protein KJ041_03730 [Gammaproteobacteria bacterium]|nr:hypothetical protein [Gammaproteobacteria bacterium]